MIIIDRLPISTRPHLLTVHGEVVQVDRNQIVVWVAIGDGSRFFPAVLDTGHSHNFSIAERHLRHWCGIPSSSLKQVGELEIDRERIAQHAAIVHIRQERRSRGGGGTYPLEMPQGISVFPHDSPGSPRLPLLGLRAILSNHLMLIVHGKRCDVSLRTIGWQWPWG
jgi:hypothetical protein